MESKKEKKSKQDSELGQLFDSDILINHLCEWNCITRDAFIKGCDNVEALDMFLFNFPQIHAMNFFPNLKKLCLVQQEISVIEGLECLVNLEALWICECRLTKIQGLQNCVRLKQLYLYSNDIRKIEGLENLTELDTLWLFDNHISVVEGLDNLVNLRVLWLAKNQIETLRETLDSNQKLEELNVAANRIGYFKEIPYLQRLRSLRTLCFSDPHFGDNPVCSLCNYQTYTLYHLSGLTSLDTLVVSEDARHIADATFVKKRMYYNMRIKTLKRNTSNVLRKGHKYKQNRVAQINLSLNVLLRLKKELERDMDEGEIHSDMAEDHLALVKSKQSAALSAINDKYALVSEIQSSFETFREKIIETSDRNIGRLLVELDTGGNIRFEEGKVNDVWYLSCVDLVRSRFASSEFESEFGVNGLRVNRVTRIFNRFLRNRFEHKLETMVDISDPNYKKSLEYLFYSEPLSLSGEVYRVMEEGFRSIKEYEDLGLDGAVPLTNSLAISDFPRLKSLCGPGDSRLTRKSGEFTHGILLVVKVFLGKCAVDSASVLSSSSKASPRSSRLGGDSGPVKSTQFPDHNSVYRPKLGDPKQRTWYVFDNALVLPEYLVEYEYIPEGKPPEEIDIAEEIVAELQPQTETDAVDMRAFAPAFATMVQRCNEICPVTAESNHYDDACAAVLNMPPAAQPRTKIFVMLPENISTFARTTSLQTLTYLNLTGNSIRKMESLTSVPNLRTLILSFNEIQKMEGLGDCPMLERVDLGFNLLKRIEGFKGMTKLTTFELNNNLIYRLEDINVLKRYTPALTELNLRNNPICESKNYRYNVLRRLSGLTSLDGQAVMDREKITAVEKASQMTLDLIHRNASNERKAGWSLSALPFAADPSMPPSGRASPAVVALPPPPPSTSASSSPLDSARPGSSGGMSVSDSMASIPPSVLGGLAGDTAWCAKIQEVCLNRMKIRKIQNLERFMNLRRASFADNEISRIEGLEACTLLEELNLEENRIVKLEGLQTLSHLRKLELGKNRIARVENLEHLTTLTQLSLEDNDVHTLAGIGKLINLMELYIGNNKVENVKEANHLRDLQKLIILDLSGNPLCADPEYRLYTVYNVKKLKVLDGVSIDANEITRAKDAFSGKMSTELLVERVGKAEFGSVTELNLSSCSIKEVSLLEEFSCLRDLCLDRNQLSDLAGITRLSTLVSLRVNHNRIDTPAPHKGQTSSIKWFENFPSLEVLQLGFNQITNIAALNLSRLSSLRSLDLQSNEIAKVDGLDHLTQLRELVLDKNKIRAVEERAFAYLINLTELHIEENSLRSLECMRPLPKLQSLFLGCNRISDINEFEKLAHMEKLTQIVMSFNPVSRKSMYRPNLLIKVPSLQTIDGKEVSQEEKERMEEYLYPSTYQPNGMGVASAMMGVPVTMFGGGGPGGGAQVMNPMMGMGMGMGLMGAPPGMMIGAAGIPKPAKAVATNINFDFAPYGEPHGPAFGMGGPMLGIGGAKAPVTGAVSATSKAKAALEKRYGRTNSADSGGPQVTRHDSYPSVGADYYTQQRTRVGQVLVADPKGRTTAIPVGMLGVPAQVMPGGGGGPSGAGPAAPPGGQNVGQVQSGVHGAGSGAVAAASLRNARVFSGTTPRPGTTPGTGMFPRVGER